MSHTAEIIAVGTELLLGNIVNTNAQEISQALSGVGVNVFWHTVVGDNPERLRQVLEIAISPSRPSARPLASRWCCGRMCWRRSGTTLPGTST